MPRFEIYVDVDVSVTYETARFTVEAEDADAALALAQAAITGAYDGSVYPTGTVAGGTPGAPIAWQSNYSDSDGEPSFGAVKVEDDATTVGEIPAGWREIEGGWEKAE